jgi:hypothetical protein
MRIQVKASAAALVMCCGLHGAYAADAPLLSLGMEHFRDTATVSEDRSHATTNISTQNGFAEHRGLMRTVWSDEYLNAAIDQKSGRKSFQVYAFVTYSGDLHNYRTASFRGADGPQQVPVIALGQESANCAVGPCTYTEHVAFPVDEGMLRQLAADYVPGRAALWHFKLLAKSGGEYAGALSNAEIAGLLAKVDAYDGALPLAEDTAASAALARDLGVSGMPAAAAAEQPERAGIVIVAIEPGSVAHRAGLIVGDILYEFDGRPIRTLGDLSAALAASAAKPSAAARIFRGTAPQTVTVRF